MGQARPGSFLASRRSQEPAEIGRRSSSANRRARQLSSWNPECSQLTQVRRRAAVYADAANPKTILQTSVWNTNGLVGKRLCLAATEQDNIPICSLIGEPTRRSPIRFRMCIADSAGNPTPLHGGMRPLLLFVPCLDGIYSPLQHEGVVRCLSSAHKPSGDVEATAFVKEVCRCEPFPVLRCDGLHAAFDITLLHKVTQAAFPLSRPDLKKPFMPSCLDASRLLDTRLL